MPFIGNQATANSKIKKYSFTATASQTAFSVPNGSGDELQVFLNGVLLKETTDYTYTTSTVTLGSGATVSDIVDVHVYQSFSVADAVKVSGDTMTGELEVPTVTITSSISAANLVGMIAPFAMTSVPTGWLACDGSAVSRSTYSALFTAISTTWGVGDGSSTFNLPDLEGAFLRGTGANATHNMADGNDFAGPSVGSFENDQIQGHRHGFRFKAASTGNSGFTASTVLPSHDNASNQLGTTSAADTTNSVSVDAPTALDDGTPREGDETRPFNAGVKFCIKY